MLCVDFELFTADGEVLPLESWRLAWDPSRACPSASQDSLYTAFRLALATTLTAARATPMHRYYVRRQRHVS